MTWTCRCHPVRRALALAMAALCAAPAFAQPSAEYRVKAAFIYNFAAFVQWPAAVGDPLNFCVFGPDPFGDEFDRLEGRSIGSRTVRVSRPKSTQELRTCQMLFIAGTAAERLPQLAENLRGLELVIVTDQPRAQWRGETIRMAVVDDRVVFDVDLSAARAAGLSFSAKMLRLAREVRQ